MIKIFFLNPFNDMNALTPNNAGVWGNLKSVDNINDADWIITLQHIPATNKNTILFVREPPCICNRDLSKVNYKYKFDYSNFYHIFTDINLVGGYDFSINNFDYWNNINYTDLNKTKTISAIASNKQFTNGHKNRFAVITKLINSDIDIDIYGMRLPFKNIKYKGSLDAKKEGLFDYNYSICIENCSIPNYFTEKFTDAILCWTIPIYWGCTNIDKYFPSGCYYLIDVSKPNIIEQIKNIIQKPVTEENIKAIAEARRKILYEYNIWPVINKILN